MYVYWIKRKAHTNIITDGYVGVSKDFKKRFEQHKKSNSVVSKAITKYDDIEVIPICFTDICTALFLEEKLRPEDEIGWNIVKGGGLPPNFKGRKRSDDFKSKASERMKGNTFIRDWNIENGHTVVSDQTRSDISKKLKGKKLDETSVLKMKSTRNSLEFLLSCCNQSLKIHHIELFNKWSDNMAITRKLASDFNTTRQSLKTIWKMFDMGYVPDSAAGTDTSAGNADNKA